MGLQAAVVRVLSVGIVLVAVLVAGSSSSSTSSQNNNNNMSTAATTTPVPATASSRWHKEVPCSVCLLVEPSPLTYVSGYANRFQALLQYLATVRDTAELVTTEVVASDHEVPDTYLGFPVHYTRGMPLPHYPLMSISVDYTFQTLRTIRRMKPDIIHASSPGLLVFTGLLASRLYQRPLVVSYHTHLPVYLRSYVPNAFGIRRLTEFVVWILIRLVHNLADLTVVTSPQIQDEFHQHGVRRCEVWQKGIDTNRFHPSYYNASMRYRLTEGHPDSFLIVYVGRLAAEKRLKDLRAVLESLPGAYLCLVGAGPQQLELQAYFRGTRTVFTGQLEGVALSQAFASADVFCMPSDSETLGFVVLESMASGVPVVGAAAGGVLDLIQDGQTGFLVKPGDTAAYIDRLRQLQQDPILRKRMAHKARSEMEKWSWQSSMEKLRNEQYSAAIRNFHNRFEQKIGRFLGFSRPVKTHT